MDNIQEKLEMEKRQEYLKMHPYAIFLGSDGKYWTYFPDKKKKRVARKRNTKKEIEDLVVEYWKCQAEVVTVKDAFEEWVNHLIAMKQISQATHLRYTQDFNRYFDQIQSQNIKLMTHEKVLDFIEEQVKRFDLTAKALSNLKTITRGIFKRAKRLKYVDFNIEDVYNNLEISEKSLRKVRKQNAEEVFDDQELEIILNYLKEHDDIVNLAILLMFCSGIRVGELVTLQWCDIEKDMIQIRHTETRYIDENGHYVYSIKETPKTEAGDRKVFIPQDSMWIIKRIQKINPFGEYIFMKNGKRINTAQIRKRLWYICKKLPVIPKSPHKIRKTYGSILLDSNVDWRFIMSQMGHADILCTENFYHKDRKTDTQKRKMINGIKEISIAQ